MVIGDDEGLRRNLRFGEKEIKFVYLILHSQNHINSNLSDNEYESCTPNCLRKIDFTSNDFM